MKNAAKPVSTRESRVLLQVPVTTSERRQLKHRAIEEGSTLGQLVRGALGLPPLAVPEEATM